MPIPANVYLIDTANNLMIVLHQMTTGHVTSESASKPPVIDRAYQVIQSHERALSIDDLSGAIGSA